MNLAKAKYTQLIKAEAKRLGFFACGIAEARFLEEEADTFDKWLKSGFNGDMYYMENHYDKRLNPKLLVPGAKSVISLLMSYFPKEVQTQEDVPRIAKYAYGEDYHYVVKDKIYKLMQYIKDEIGEVSGRVFTDSAPVFEKKWAELAGIAWRGKNSNMLTKKGSFFFIGELIIDLELEYDTPINSYCGTCTRCIDACPTQAITEPYVIDANKCISYLTIEYKESLPEELKSKFNNNLFGCDICQDVCPFNRKPLIHNEKRFEPVPKLLQMTERDWHAINEKNFKTIFGNSAISRAKYTGLKRNLAFINKKD